MGDAKMLRRKIYENLLNWKSERHQEKVTKTLLIKGARQVGKTYIINEFGQNEYSSYIHIDFFRQPEFKAIFDGDLTSDEILKRMTLYSHDFMLVPGDTLIFLDEIQCCGNARTAIKFLAQDFRIDVVSSGSLLGLTYSEDDDESTEVPESVPVGYEMQMTMYSLDFETIVSCGKNAFYLHHSDPERNGDGIAEEGSIIQVDFGARVNGYCAGYG